MINEHAVKVAADCFVKQCCNYRRIDTAGKCKQHFIIAYLLSYLLNLNIYKVMHAPIGLCFADIENKVMQYIQSILRIAYFWMELYGIDLISVIAAGRKCTCVTACQLGESFCKRRNLISM